MDPVDETHTTRLVRRPISLPTAEGSVQYTEINQDDEAPPKKSYHNHRTTKSDWTPFWCQRTVLVAFLLTFTAMLIALEIVNNYSQKHHGLVGAVRGEYYLWTYGPTAIFTLLLALWNRVDYRVRQMHPWTVLISEERKPASQTVLLNYISPTRPEICWYSIRNKHWTVLISSIVVLTQTLLIVMSTTLFTLAPSRKVVHDVVYKANTMFRTNTSAAVETADYENAATSGYIYDAHQTLNLSLPFGTTLEHVYQKFSVDGQNDLSAAIWQVDVDVLDLEYECEPADLVVNEWYAFTSVDCTAQTTQNISVISSNCTSVLVSSLEPPVSYGDDGETSFFAFFRSELCGEYNLEVGSTGFALGVGTVQQSGLLEQNPYRDPDSGLCVQNFSTTYPTASMNLLRSQAWNCRMSPLIRRGSVSFNNTELVAGSLPEISLLADTPRRLFTNGSSFWMVDYAWMDQVDGEPLTSLRTDSLPAGIVSPHTVLMPFMDHVLRNLSHLSQDDVLETDALLNATQRVATSVYTQYVQLVLTGNDDSKVIGSATVNSDRLLVRQVSLRLMESAMGITLILLVLLTTLINQTSCCPYDPVSLKSMCKVLESSRVYYTTFKGLGAVSDDALARRIGSSIFTSRFIGSSKSSRAHDEPKFIIEKVDNTDDLCLNQALLEQASKNANWWRPWTILLLCRSIMTSVVILVIVALQVLLKISGDQQGLANVSATNKEHLAWSLIPATLMTSIAIYLGAVDSVYRTFGPYQKLKVGALAAPSVLAHYLSQTRVELLVTSLRHRQVALLFITLCTLLSSFFTIVVSGVFSPSQIASQRSTSISQQSWFRTDGSDDNGTLGNSGKIAGLILQSNLSYPSWTFENLAFGAWQMSAANNLEMTRSQTLEATIPAIRASLNCTVYDQQDIPDLSWSNIIANNLDGNGTHYVGYVQANYFGGSGCTLNISAVNGIYMDSSAGTGGPPFSWYGFAPGIHPGCPQFNFYWGWEDPGELTIHNSSVWHISADANQTRVSHARAISCFDVIEQVDVATTFRMPTFQIDETIPPRPDESTAKVFSEAAVGIPYASLRNTGYSQLVDPGTIIFRVINVTYGFDLWDRKNQDDIDMILKYIKSAHGIVRAQQYNSVLREATVEDNQSQTVQAVLIDSSRWRLTQNKISTHVLCGLLAIALIFASIASFLINTKEVLPKDPCTIAAMTSLLADSNLLTTAQNDTMQDLFRGSAKWRLFSRKPRSRRQHKDDAIYKMGHFTRGGGRSVFTIDRVTNGSVTDIPLDTQLEEHGPAMLVHSSESARPRFPAVCPPRKPVPTCSEQAPCNAWTE